MKTLLTLLAMFLFMSCSEDPVGPEPQLTPTEIITQNGYWKNRTLLDPPFFGIDEIVIYFHFDKDENGGVNYSFFTEGEETEKKYEPFIWFLVEENDTENVSHLYLHVEYNEEFSPPQVVEIFCLSKTSMGLGGTNDEPVMFNFVKDMF